MNTPILSIIIPVFNTEEHIKKCLDSVVHQNIQNIELIIVNDQSTDQSENIILTYKNRYDFIKYFIMTDKGFAGGSRNIGLEQATGRYIGFVDSDDWVDANMFEAMIQSAEKNQADIAICGVLNEFDTSQCSSKRYFYEKEEVLTAENALQRLVHPYHMFFGISPIACNKIYRHDFLRRTKMKFLKLNYNDDDVFNFMCILNANKVVIVPDVYYHYFQRQGSIMHSFSKKYFDDLFVAFQILETYLQQTHIFKIDKTVYFLYFERCLASILNILMKAKVSTHEEKELMDYLFSKLTHSFPLKQYLHYVSTDRIKKFLIHSI